jgi:hypothetical protein
MLLDQLRICRKMSDNRNEPNKLLVRIGLRKTGLLSIGSNIRLGNRKFLVRRKMLANQMRSNIKVRKVHALAKKAILAITDAMAVVRISNNSKAIIQKLFQLQLVRHLPVTPMEF